MIHICLLLAFQIHNYGPSSAAEKLKFPTSQNLGEAILAGCWPRTQELLEKMKQEKRLPGPHLIVSLCEYSGSSQRYANILTGIRILRDYGVDVKSVSDEALSTTIGQDEWGQVTERLIQYGANPNGRKVKVKGDLNDGAPISASIEFNKTPIVTEILLKHGASPDVYHDFGGYNHLMANTHYTPLMTAAAENRKEFIPVLLKYHAKVDLRCPEDGMTALHLAARWNNADIVRMLLKSKANRRMRSKAGQTPLQVARKFKAKEAVKALESK